MNSYMVHIKRAEMWPTHILLIHWYSVTSIYQVPVMSQISRKLMRKCLIIWIRMQQERTTSAKWPEKVRKGLGMVASEFRTSNLYQYISRGNAFKFFSLERGQCPVESAHRVWKQKTNSNMRNPLHVHDHRGLKALKISFWRCLLISAFRVQMKKVQGGGNVSSSDY